MNEEFGSGLTERSVQGQKGGRNKTIVFVLSILVIILIAALVVSGVLLKQEKEKTDNPTEVATQEIEKIKGDVGKLIILPEDSEPTIATVVDADKLRQDNPEFYKNASNGDKLLIYSDRAILYNPDRDIIVNVAPIIRQPDGDGLDSGTSEDSLEIEILNASGDSESLVSVETSINELGTTYQISGTKDATGKNYQGNVIYDLTGGTKQTLVEELAQKLSAEIKTELPTEEGTSTADVVVIIGK